MKKTISTILALVLTLSLSTVAFANEQKVSAFSDVPADHWAYSAITNMTEKGLFSGTSTPINGVGTFSPDKTMSRAEFVTVVVRALYKTELDAMPKSDGAWYQNAYFLAIKNGILQPNDLNGGDLAQPMTRQEMAMVLVRAAEKNGETPSQLIDTGRIADYSTVGTAYRDYVVKAYSMGMLCGTDNKGTYAPMGTLNRGAAATVLYRLVEPSSRQAVDFNKPVTPPASENQTFNEGSIHQPPKAGDTVIKADGTKVVLKATKVGDIYVLGFGQSVDIISGVQAEDGLRTEGNLGRAWHGYQAGDLTPFLKDPLTSEVHTEFEWKIVESNTRPSGKGSHNGEIRNTYFEWDSTDEYWYWVGPVNY